ncbi:von Willebrand factor type A [Penicillium maclennaniae]|uniref:von Willebrand factor type A n=1 Tax=Penicillium maclennaniae TaxID=1343394 RepID=UPI00253FBF8B|nr:von Willebrand factor type A [Penicillium maclennaniae]KAJ5681986.1 von Willebrand factor type A [Penicillium maclennaniae]
MPQIGLDVHATILATNSRTVITRTFVNPSSTEAILEVFYSFPLYENPSIVGLNCHVGDRVVKGVVGSKEKANHIYQEAKSKGKTAAILDQSQNAADVFSTRLGNVLAGETVDGIRYMVPVSIAPRYGAGTGEPDPPGGVLLKTEIRVDIIVERSTFESCYAAVKLRENVTIREDFVLTQALMITLVPKFSLPSDASEIVFFIDRSGSMSGKIPTSRSVSELFLKSVPLGVPFNIVSFGSSHKSLWPRRKVSSEESLAKAVRHTRKINADMGVTEILGALQAAVKNRYKDKVLEALVLTDGDIWDQSTIFDFVNKENQENSTRFSTLGIGNSVLHALVNGISRAGKGFSQTVIKNEDLNKTVIRMLKGALMPRLSKSRLDMKIPGLDEEYVNAEPAAEPISFSNQEHKEKKDVVDLRQPLPNSQLPTSCKRLPIFRLYSPSSASNFYVLFSHDSTSFREAITLRAESKHGPVELEIPIQGIGKGETLHQLAT